MRIEDKIEKYLVSEAKVVEFDRSEVMMLDKAFKRKYTISFNPPDRYSLSDKRLHVYIKKISKGFEVDSDLSDETSDGDKGPLNFKEKTLKGVINKILKRM